MESKEITIQVLFINYWQTKIDQNIPNVHHPKESSTLIQIT